MPAMPPVCEVSIALDRATAARLAPPPPRRSAREPEGVRAAGPARSFAGLTVSIGAVARQAIAEARAKRAGTEAVLPLAPEPAPISISLAPPRDLADALAGYTFAQLYTHALDGLRRARINLEHAEDLASGRHEPRELRRDPTAFAPTPGCVAEFVATARVKAAEAEALCAVLALCAGREPLVAQALAGEGA
ncbi:hypothetical protein OPKNFCMD_3853 [Methylobacterium crusticola]|uniref:Uncharacterized protein n=1 Tax=Methylobacterium crusticola TaxID=1697972 RepID=A0ABQ4R0A1_9HYPH|nr:hypothetical protein [Methylobacterium crusticola]GJD51102.1 hypothetical protein OPKNFCMD_3853 [Methylobacterium crusticola]